MDFQSRFGTTQRYAFDWYSFTPEISRDSFLDLVLSDFAGSYLVTGRGRMGYSSSDLIYSVSGSVLATVLHNSGSDCHVVSTGATADIFGRWVRGRVKHLVSRIDIALDYLEGDFQHMRQLFLAAAVANNVKSRYIGPPAETEATDSSGRTIYLGSRSSVGMFRIYEKGRQLKCPDHPNWVRVEYEFKPKNRKAREYYSTCSVQDIASSTRISTAVYQLLAVEVGASPCRAGQHPIDPEFEKTVRHLKKQYSRTLQRIAHDLDFDPEAFIRFLLE